MKRILANYKDKVKSAEEIRKELKCIKGNLADEILKIRSG
jgi:hypothetical protein